MTKYIYTTNTDKPKSIIIISVITHEKELVIPDEIEGLPVSEIKDYTFENCKHLQRVTLPVLLNKLSPKAFDNNYTIKEIIFQGYEDEFKNRFNLLISDNITITYEPTEYYVIAGQYTYIGVPFYINELVEIPEGVHTIVSLCDGYYANLYDDCVNDSTRVLIIPNTVTKIQADAFKKCVNLRKICFLGNEDDWKAISENVNIPKDVKVIFHRKFRNVK